MTEHNKETENCLLRLIKDFVHASQAVIHHLFVVVVIVVLAALLLVLVCLPVSYSFLFCHSLL